MDYQNKICQCCGVPLKDELVSCNLDGTVNTEYCKWCYVNGMFTYQNMDDLIDACIPHMAVAGFDEKQARQYMKQLLPILDYWRNK